HTRFSRDWSSDVCSSDLDQLAARFAGKSPTAETITAIKERFGFDDPLAVQYGNFLKSIVAGDTYDTGVEKIDCPAPCLGYSFRKIGRASCRERVQTAGDG